MGLLGLVLIACRGGDDSDAGPTGSGAIASATTNPETTPTAAPSASAAASETATLPAASPTPAGTPKPQPTYAGYQIFGDFQTQEAIDFPENLMTVVETGCIQCDGPTDALYRVWRNSGETHVDKLIDAAYSGSKDSEITSFALRPDLSEIVVTICTDCGNGKPLAESPETMYDSKDGGRTWQVLTTTEPGKAIFVYAVTAQGIVVDDQGGGNLRYLNGDSITPPQGAKYLVYDSHFSGEMHWAADDGSTVLDSQGNTVALVEPGSAIHAIATGDESNAPVTWQEFTGEGQSKAFTGWNVTTIGPDGKLAGFRSQGYAAALIRLRSGALLGGMADSVNASGSGIGYVDPSNGTLTPISGALVAEPFGDGQKPIGRNNLVGALEGPFLRVTTGTPCVSIRAEADISTAELTCAADGTLFYNLDSQVTVGAETWTKVGLLDGRQGYTDAGNLTSD
jgi:hypothetical protein